MATSQAIHEHASDHTRLLTTLAELIYVPSAFAQQTSYLNDLNNHLKESEERVEELSKKTKKALERKKHGLLRNPSVKHFAHKLSGHGETPAAKGSKEEMEFLEALEQELVEKEQLEAIRQARDEASHIHDDLSSKIALYESSKTELDALYHHIFDGPTAEFPQDDQLEQAVQDNQDFLDELQKIVKTEPRVADLLADAERCLVSCARDVSGALQASQWDICGARFKGADTFERNALNNAQSLALEVEALMHQAQSVSPFVKPIGNLTIPQRSSMSDVAFDDTRFHRKIEETNENVKRALDQLREQRQSACQRANNASIRLSEASQNLDNSRLALYNFRKETFQAYARGERPPDYRREGPRQCPTPAEPPPVFSVATTAVPEEVQSSQQTSTSYKTKQPVQVGSAWGSNNPYAIFFKSGVLTSADASPHP